MIVILVVIVGLGVVCVWVLLLWRRVVVILLIIITILLFILVMLNLINLLLLIAVMFLVFLVQKSWVVGWVKDRCVVVDEVLGRLDGFTALVFLEITIDEVYFVFTIFHLWLMWVHGSTSGSLLLFEDFDNVDYSTSRKESTSHPVCPGVVGAAFGHLATTIHRIDKHGNKK